MDVDSLNIDSMVSQADSVIILPNDFDEAFSPFDTRLDTALIARTIDQKNAEADTVAIEVPPAWISGLEPEPRSMQPGNRSGFLLVIALMFIVMAFNFRHLRRLIKSYTEELLSARHGRSNVFDEHPAGDVRVLVLLVVQSIVCAGILLSEGITRVLSDRPELLTGGTVAAISGVVWICYMLQLVAYKIVGYTFSTPEGSREWLRGFNASQALLGVALMIPAILAIFYPEVAELVVVVGFILYIIARLLFIFKGFRIFYNKIGSLLYFILYLCSLEIIPVIMVFKFACILADKGL